MAGTGNFSSALFNQSASDVGKPLFEKVIDGYLTPIVVLFGVIGNCLNLAILGNRKSRSSSAMMLLLGMSSFDLFVLLVQVPHVVFGELMQFSTPSIELSILQRQYIAYIRYPFTNIGLTGASILSATVAIDRYAAIKNVESLHKVFKRKTKCFTISMAVFSLLFNSPKFFDMKPCTELVARAVRTGNNATEYVYELPRAPYVPSPIASNPWYSNGSYWLSAIVNTLLPQLVMVVFGSIVVVSFAKLKSINSKMPSSSRENRISLATRMVVATICVFFVTSFLSVVLIAASCVMGRQALISNPVLGRLRIFSNFLAITKSGMNFILYCSTCAHYRGALRGFFCKFRSSPQSNPQNARRRLIDSSSTRSDKKQSSSGRLEPTTDRYLTVPALLQVDPISNCSAVFRPMKERANDNESDSSSPI